MRMQVHVFIGKQSKPIYLIFVPSYILSPLMRNSCVEHKHLDNDCN